MELKKPTTHLSSGASRITNWTAASCMNGRFISMLMLESPVLNAAIETSPARSTAWMAFSRRLNRV